MAVSDGAIFIILGTFIVMFMYFLMKGKVIKIVASIFLFLLGIGILNVDPDYGFTGYIVMGVSVILMIHEIFGGAKR